jgi:hypothetical protein
MLTNTKGEIMRYLILFIISIITSISILYSQITPNDGDWSQRYIIMHNTPQAELMVRTGDIDNLNFGWPVGFDPFSGNNTPIHPYPWTPDTLDPTGTDRIMVITSYVGTPPNGRDGYTSSTSRPGNLVHPVTLTFDTLNINIQSAILQMFVDDFQAPRWWASYQVFFDGVRIPFLETIINQLVQTGPIGKIISVEIPANYLYLLDDDTLSILIDDYTTGAGDGYAIDFAKLLLNPSALFQTGTITGTIRDLNTSMPLEDVLVVANGLVQDSTDATGTYTIDSVLAGLVSVQTFKAGYGSQIKITSLIAGQTSSINFDLVSPAPQILEISPLDSATAVPFNSPISVKFNMPMDINTINSSTFILSDKDSSLNGSFTKTDTTFIFYPDSLLRSEMDYWVTLTTGIKNTNSINLERDFSWVFTTRTTFGLKPVQEIIMKNFFLQQNYPNPFNPSTTIEFDLLKSSEVTLKIFNILGEEVATLLSTFLLSGSYSYEWDASNLASGVYLYRLQAGDPSKSTGQGPSQSTGHGFVETRKMVLMR